MMINNRTDKDWEYFGKKDPYYGVLSAEKFRYKNLNSDLRREFFKSGQDHLELLIKIIRAHLNPDFTPRSALDFGCGVGRIVIPLASICKSVTGVDVSDAMLQEAKKNCEIYGLKNVQLIKGDDSLADVSGFFDFIHSFIAFQHIPVARGERIFKRLIELLQEDGIGAIHFTYSRQQAPIKYKIIYWWSRYVPFFNNLLNLKNGRPFREPLMQLNEYNLNRLIQILQVSGCHHSYLRFTEHDVIGIIFFFQKKRLGFL